MIGTNFSSDFFKHSISDPVLSDLLVRIAEETEQDYEALGHLLEDLGVQTTRVEFDEGDYNIGSQSIPPATPGTNFVAVGETLYACNRNNFYKDFLKTINRDNICIGNLQVPVNSTNAYVIGKDVFWDVPGNVYDDQLSFIEQRWKQNGFRVSVCRRGRYPAGVSEPKLEQFNGPHHRDDFTAVRPGCGVSVLNQALDQKFKDWDIFLFQQKSWADLHDFWQMKYDAGLRGWTDIDKWISSQDKESLIHIARAWLDVWQPLVQKQVLDTNMLTIDEHTVLCNNTHEDLFKHFGKHKVDPVVFHFRHRYFWGACGLNDIILPLYREGTQEEYFA